MDSFTSVDALVVEDLSQQKLPARHLVAAFRQAGWRAQMVDLNDGADAIIALARRTMPRLIVSSILFADRVNEHLALMTALRSVLPHTHLTIAGHLPAFAHTDLLAACPALDSVMRGEEEELARITSTIPQAHDTKPRNVSRIIPLDDLPFPARDDGIASYQGYGFATVEASRGCYHACSFCLPSAFHHARGAPYRLRSIPNLVDEIESLYRCGARLFLFDDEQFLPPMSQRAERIASLADELERRALRIAFTIKCRSDDANADAELFRRLQELGLVRVYVGIESGNQATLDLYNKRVTVQQNIEALGTLSELGLVADFRAVMFHPWSTFEAIETEIEFLDRVSPWMSTAFDFRELEIYPGTPLARRMKMSLRAERSRVRVRLSIGDCFVASFDSLRSLRIAPRNDKSTMWLMDYTIADPRAELLRRCSRLVFDPAGKYRDAHRSLTTAWFAQLLAQRFQPSASDAERARELKSIAAKMNRESLAMWREMLEFTRTGDIYAPEQVNARAREWVERINRDQVITDADK